MLLCWMREGRTCKHGEQRIPRCECDSVVNGGVDVMQDIEGSIPGAPGRFVVICRQKRVCDCQVWLSTAC
jgi:hypothetical protein